MKENNIFEGAKFGDKFLTRDGRTARFWHKDPHNYLEDTTCYNLILENECVELICTSNGLNFGSKGNWGEDIVSRYQEPIDEEHLACLVSEFNKKIHDDASIYSDEDIPKYLTFGDIYRFMQLSYDEGYRDAKKGK